MKKYILFALFGILLMSCECFGRKFRVKNELSVPVSCDLDSTTAGCHFHFEGAIPAYKEVENGTGWQCDIACYENIKIQAVDKSTHIKFDIPSGFQCYDYNIIVWRENDTVYLAASYQDWPWSWDNIKKQQNFKVSMPWKDFYPENATVKKIVNNSDAEIKINSSAKKNGYGKIDLTIPANKQGTISELSGKKMNSITVPDETVGAGAIEFFIKRDNKDNRYEIYSMSGGNVHLRGPDANGNWADLVYDPGLNYALVTDQNKIPRLEASK